MSITIGTPVFERGVQGRAHPWSAVDVDLTGQFHDGDSFTVHVARREQHVTLRIATAPSVVLDIRSV